jgi:uncharacterized protein involved in exopolysaccharide biosynthesis
MPIRDFFGVLRRRWVIVLVGFLMTVGLSGASYWFFKPTYEITGTVLLLPPESASVPGQPVNPYLQLGGLQQILDLVGVSLSDQSTQLELKTLSKDVEYTVKADVRTSSPLLLVDVKTSTPETATRIRDLLVQRIPGRLESMQNSLHVSAKDRVTSTVVTLDGEAQEVGKNRLRAAVVAGVAGMAVTLLGAALWDRRRLRHPRRGIGESVGTEQDEVTNPAVEEAPAPAPGDRDEVPISPASALRDLDALEALEVTADAPSDAVR